MTKMRKNARMALISGTSGVLLVLALFIWRLAPHFVLNRTVRSVALRLVQIELLSRSTGSDFQVDFLHDRYRVQVFDKNTDDWIIQRQIRFPYGITCGPDVFIYRFSRGKMVEFLYRDRDGKVPRSVILDFFSLRSERVRSLIFYRQGDWKVLR
jgi:hypothetical protein